MADLNVTLVATDREVWSGQAKLVSFGTPDGEVGVMPGHSPMLAILREGPVLIRKPDDSELHAAVHAGFVVVDAGAVIILAETAELAEEIDIARAEALLEEAKASTPSASATAAERRAETRLRLVGKLK